MSKQSQRRLGVTYFLGRSSTAWRAGLDTSRVRKGTGQSSESKS